MINYWAVWVALVLTQHLQFLLIDCRAHHTCKKPEALKSLYRSPGYKKNQLALCKKNNWSYVKTMSCSGSHLGITINIKNTKFEKDLPMIDSQFRFNQCNSFREEYISVFSPYDGFLNIMNWDRTLHYCLRNIYILFSFLNIMNWDRTLHFCLSGIFTFYFISSI
jgi:hypothetical protein